MKWAINFLFTCFRIRFFALSANRFHLSDFSLHCDYFSLFVTFLNVADCSAYLFQLNQLFDCNYVSQLCHRMLSLRALYESFLKLKKYNFEDQED